MIKKAVLLVIAPFLIFVSASAFAFPPCAPDNYLRDTSRFTYVINDVSSNGGRPWSDGRVFIQYNYTVINKSSQGRTNKNCRLYAGSVPDSVFARYVEDPMVILEKTDEQCSEFSGESISLSPSSVNYLNSGGSVKAAGGACEVTGSGGVSVCVGEGDSAMCTINLVGKSSGVEGRLLDAESSPDVNLVSGSLDRESAIDASLISSDYLTELPGQCTASSCVTVGDKSFIVDWDKAPDWFEYVDNNGNVQRKPTTPPTDPGSDTGGGSDGGDVPGGCFGNCYPGGGSDGNGNDSGNDSGGGSSGGGSGDNTGGVNTGGGSTGGGSSGGGSGGGNSGGSDGSNTGGGSTGGGSSVPDFEFDDSDIIEAIGSSGESTQKGLDAVSNDVSKAIGEQTEETQGMFDGLGETITNALGLGTCYANSKQTEDGNPAASSDQGLLGCIQKIANGMVGNIAEKFTEEVGEGDDLFNTSGLNETLDGAAEQEQQYGDDVNSLMDEIGDGSSSGIADQVTSRLPSLPSGSCTPLQFGMMEISCQAHNTIKLWLSWIIYFWTVVSIVDTFFRSGQRTA